MPGCEDAYFIDYGAEVGVRQTRSIDGMARLMNADVVGTSKRADAIARSSWPIELHYGAKPKTEWLVDDYYEVPFGTLVPKEGRNIIIAGRCLSAEHEALASCRVTAQCFEYGRAAAIAADLSIRDDLAFPGDRRCGGRRADEGGNIRIERKFACDRPCRLREFLHLVR